MKNVCGAHPFLDALSTCLFAHTDGRRTTFQMIYYLCVLT